MADCRPGDRICTTINFLKNLKFSTFCRRKSYSQISMDIALLMINAAHLTQIIRTGPTDNLYAIKLGLVSLSIFLEVSIGLLLGIKERYDIEDESQQRAMNFLNDLAVWLVFFSVTVHVFVSVFVEQHHIPLHYGQYLQYANCSAT